VDAILQAARPVYRLYGAEKNILIEHPDCGHEFPPEMRELAYRTLDSVLK
jgi:hypothetical protein